jgi:acetyltransferase-like isoleucine patch superfamily enzyme
MPGINMDEVLRKRREFRDFLHGEEKAFEFTIDCDIPNRIAYIYGVIFPGFSRLRFYVRFLVARLAQHLDYSPFKVFLYRRVGMKIGKGAFISPDVILDPHFPELIEIGEYAILGWGCHLFSHEFTGTTYRAGRIRVGAGAVIGGFTTVRGGVTIGEKAQVSSMCLVYKDVPSNYYIDSVVILNKALVDVYREERHG